MDIMEQMDSNMATRQKVIDFLRKNTFSVVSTISPEGKINSGSVLYLFDDNLEFYFVTREQSRKHVNLEQNDNVAVVVGTGQDNITVQFEGKARQVKDSREYFVEELKKREDLNKLFFGPLITFEGIDFILYKVRIEWIRYVEIVNGKVHTEEYYRPVA